MTTGEHRLRLIERPPTGPRQNHLRYAVHCSCGKFGWQVEQWSDVFAESVRGNAWIERHAAEERAKVAALAYEVGFDA